MIEYLEFVKAIEAKRKEMRVDFNPALDMMKAAYGDQLGFALDDNDTNKPLKKANQGYSKYVQDWNRLMQAFLSKNPPEPCRQFAGAYSTALGNYVSAMVKIQVAMQQSDLNSLMALRKTAQPDIDKMLTDADGQLKQVTDRYGLKKTYNITPDTDVDTILGQ